MARVLVTGATGFIAAHTIAELLAKGYDVRGTVRSRAKALQEAALAKLPGAERLELVEADLMQPGSFDAPAQGCETMLHIASPYVVSPKDPQRDLVDPAVNGTQAALTAAAKAGVKRVVLTSSVAAITDEPPQGHVLTEADWNEKSSLQRNPYYYSKALAERSAWAFVEREKPSFGLVVVNPFFVIGPSYTRALNESNKILADLTKGVFPGAFDLTWGFVDVRDVAAAHVAAMEAPGAAGRYLCASDKLTMRAVIAEMRKLLPKAKLPTLPLDNAIGSMIARLASHTLPVGAGSYLRSHLGRKLDYDNGKIRRELGVTFRPARESIADSVADLVRWGHIQAAA